MLIYGKKRIEKKVGHAADYCPICRTVTIHSIRKITMVKHIYYVRIGGAALIGLRGRCVECSFERSVDHTAYKELMETYPSSLNELVNKTYPSVKTVYKERMRLDQAARSNPSNIDAQVRKVMIREVFELLAPPVEDIFTGEIRIDAPSGLGVAVMFLSGIIFLASGILMKEHNLALFQQTVAPAAGVLFVIGLVVMLVFMATSQRRYLSKEVRPLLVRALHPLRPRKEEIETVLSQLKTMDLAIGKKVKAQWVMDSLEKVRQPNRRTA